MLNISHKYLGTAVFSVSSVIKIKDMENLPT